MSFPPGEIETSDTLRRSAMISGVIVWETDASTMLSVTNTRRRNFFIGWNFVSAKSRKKTLPCLKNEETGIQLNYIGFFIFALYIYIMKKLFVLVCSLLLSVFLFSQNYRSATNQQYWKNHPPFAGYWQQDVDYKIKARVDEKTNIISATEELTYYNNSPDTLAFVYFHLYQNALQPGSYFDKMTKENKVTPKYGKYEVQKKNTEILTLTSNGVELKKVEDNTIVKVFLSKPLYPNDSVKFQIEFNSYFEGHGGRERRMKMFSVFGNKHYDGAHWYPRIAVYDRKFGWETDQHMEKEFYGDFGTYDVELNFANNYVVEATGSLQNQNKVPPADLKKKLDISNFKEKPMFSAPNIVTPYDSTGKFRKTWKYKAINVHDFAFTADPTYRIGEAEWNGIKCIAMAQEPNASL